VRARLDLLVLLLVGASVLYRALIPAGFMPANLSAAQNGSLLMVCHHGDLDTHEHGGDGSDDRSFEQCPFGAAMGPALLGNLYAIALDVPSLSVVQVWDAESIAAAKPRLTPPLPRSPSFFLIDFAKQ
jgi:hypothetical protein